jgi:hypothetical protein
MTSIPETSPSRLGHQRWPNDHNTTDAADQEDDDLPPVYMDAHERGSRSQPMVSDMSRLKEPAPICGEASAAISVSALRCLPLGLERIFELWNEEGFIGDELSETIG